MNDEQHANRTADLALLLIAVLSLVLAVGAFIMTVGRALAAEQTDRVTATGYRLIDRQGRERGGLIMENGKPKLYLADADGFRFVQLGMVGNAAEPTLMLQDHLGSTVHLRASDTEGSAIELLGAKHGRATMRVAPDGTVEVLLAAENSRSAPPRLLLRVDTLTSSVVLNDVNGQRRIELKAQGDNAGTILVDGVPLKAQLSP